MTLQGSNVVIIGGSSGMGLATAQLAKCEGANVFIVNRSSEKLIQAARQKRMGLAQEVAQAVILLMTNGFITGRSSMWMEVVDSYDVDLNPIELSQPKEISMTTTPTIIGWTAIITGIAGVSGLIFIILFFTIGQPFGTLNDICIGLAGLLSGVLAWMLFSEHHIQSPLNLIAFILAVAGAMIVATGSVLVIFNITGWYLAGLYMSLGNALIGLWLLILNYALRQNNPGSHGLIVFGIVTGILMALGLVVIPGIFSRVDSWEAAPWYINYIGLPGGIGYLVLYPIWCILFGRIFL